MRITDSTNFNTRSISFPVKIIIGEMMVTLHKKRELNGVLTGRATKWALKRASSPKMMMSYLISRDEKIYHFEPLVMHRRWAASFAGLYDLTLYSCEIHCFEELKVSDLRDIVRTNSKVSHSHFSGAGIFYKFLLKQDQDAIFDSNH